MRSRGAFISTLAKGDSQVALVVKNLPANVGSTRDAGSIPRSGRSPGVRNGNPLQCSCLENPVNQGAWRTTVYGVTESDRSECTSTQQSWRVWKFSDRNAIPGRAW